jgi:hypothetical protein
MGAAPNRCCRQPDRSQGFFGSYLSGAMILVVMGIGSTAPGLLQVVIDQFSQL